MNVSQYILKGRERISQAGLECADPLMHMRQIVEFAKGWDSTRLLLGWSEELSWMDLRKLEAVMQRRLRGEPFQYIAGYEWFWDSKFLVGPGVLIPRKETEILVEQLLRAEKSDRVRMAELGAGSGNIGITCLRERPQWEWFGFEKNPESLPYLKTNVETILPVGARYTIYPGDFFQLVARSAPYDWLVANPPYVPTDDLKGLSKEVRHEPKLALDGGRVGVDIIFRLIEMAPSLLKPNGRLILEIGCEQSLLLTDKLRAMGGWRTETFHDYAGLPRVILSSRV